LLTTMFLSQGVPMLVAGDEFGRTQGGNNNAYCQDNEISWLSWQNADQSLMEFTQKLIALRKKHPVFCRRRWFQGYAVRSHVNDIAWFLPEGAEMSDENWSHDFAKSLGVYLNGNELQSVNLDGKKIVDDSFYIIFNAYDGNLDYVLPSSKYAKTWVKILDTSQSCISEDGIAFNAEDTINVAGRSIVILKHKKD